MWKESTNRNSSTELHIITTGRHPSLDTSKKEISKLFTRAPRVQIKNLTCESQEPPWGSASAGITRGEVGGEDISFPSIAHKFFLKSKELLQRSLAQKAQKADNRQSLRTIGAERPRLNSFSSPPRHVWSGLLKAPQKPPTALNATDLAQRTTYSR